MKDLVRHLAHISSKNEKEAVELVYKAYSSNLCAYALKNWTVEEDIVWDLIYKSVYKLISVFNDKSFDSEAQLKAYLFRIFINYLKNAVRDQLTKKQGVKEVELQDQHAEAIKESSTESIELKTLNSILDKLEDWKRILLLLRNQGVTYAEISKLVDKPEKNLKVYYGRLKEEVKKQLEVQLKKQKSHG